MILIGVRTLKIVTTVVVVGEIDWVGICTDDWDSTARGDGDVREWHAHHRLRHEREKLADIELFIAGGSLDPMRPASYRLVRLGLAIFRLNRFHEF